MKDCETRQEELKAYHDGELPLWKRLGVRLHLARCAACREELKAMQEVREKLRHTENGGLDPALRARILASVTYSAPATESRGELARPRLRPRPLILWGAAAAGVLIGLCYRVYFMPVSSSAPSATESMQRKASSPVTAPAPAANGPMQQPISGSLSEKSPVTNSAPHRSSEQERKKEIDAGEASPQNDKNSRSDFDTGKLVAPVTEPSSGPPVPTMISPPGGKDGFSGGGSRQFKQDLSNGGSPGKSEPNTLAPEESAKSKSVQKESADRRERKAKTSAKAQQYAKPRQQAKPPTAQGGRKL